MVRVLVERRFAEPEELVDVQAQEDRFAWCLEQNGVKFIRTYFSKDRRTMLCEYEAPDAEAVRTTQRTAGLPFQRIFSATLHDWQALRGEKRNQ